MDCLVNRMVDKLMVEAKRFINKISSFRLRIFGDFFNQCRKIFNQYSKEI